jgi:Dirigent-like protein
MRARRRAPAIAAAALLVVGGGAGTAMSDSGADGRATTIHLVGHETDAGQIDLGEAGGSVGDEAVFHGALRDATDSRQVGHFEGVLTAVTPDAESLCEARVVLALPQGQIAVQGELDFGADEPFVHAITGGTGAYRNARGEFSFRHTATPAVIAITLALKG